MDLLPAMLLAGQNLVGSLNRDCGSLPYWCLNVSADYRGSSSSGAASTTSAVGGTPCCDWRRPPASPSLADVEAAMLENLHRSFDNPDGFCLPFLDWGEAEPEPALHSLRGKDWLRWRPWPVAAIVAGPCGRATVCWKPWRRAASENGTWDLTQIDYYARRGRQDPVLPPTNTHGRLIEALVWFYQAAGDALALELETVSPATTCECPRSPTAILTRPARPRIRTPTWAPYVACCFSARSASSASTWRRWRRLTGSRCVGRSASRGSSPTTWAPMAAVIRPLPAT